MATFRLVLRYLAIAILGFDAGVSVLAVPFGGVNDGAYLEWLVSRASRYPRSIFMEGPIAESGAAIHWDIVDGEIHLAVAVRSKGWVGFGISENGGMRGADVVLFSRGTLTDAHITDTLYPLPDKCQNWELVHSQSQGGFLIFEAVRLLDTGDTQDRKIINDSNLLMSPHRVIAAWGDDDSYAYHGENRVKGSIRFFGSDSTGDEWEAFGQRMKQEAEGSFELRGNNFVIPAEETTYGEFCFFENDLIQSGMPTDMPLHVIGMEPIIPKEDLPYIHHFTLYGLPSAESNDSLYCSDTLQALQELVYVWAPGDLPFSMPHNVGSPLGTNGFRSFRLQIHYNNLRKESGVITNSGVKFYFTSQKREHDLGFFQAGDPLIWLRGERVGGVTQRYSSHDFQCRGECSNFSLSEPITVIREVLHMHASGRRMYNAHIRNNNVIRVAAADYFDYDQQGGLTVVQEPIVVNPGDSFDTKCYYESSQEAVFGLSSKDEMCIAFLAYYPRQTIMNGFPYQCGYSYGLDGLNQCNSDWSKDYLTDVEDLHRSFGPAPLLCPAVTSRPTKRPTLSPSNFPTSSPTAKAFPGSSPQPIDAPGISPIDIPSPPTTDANSSAPAYYTGTSQIYMGICSMGLAVELILLLF